ncbi:MAG: hypothetical protein ACE5LF_08325 [Alphaproteobacteria bacterium]
MTESLLAIAMIVIRVLRPTGIMERRELRWSGKRRHAREGPDSADRAVETGSNQRFRAFGIRSPECARGTVPRRNAGVFALTDSLHQAFK